MTTYEEILAQKSKWKPNKNPISETKQLMKQESTSKAYTQHLKQLSADWRSQSLLDLQQILAA